MKRENKLMLICILFNFIILFLSIFSLKPSINSNIELSYIIYIIIIISQIISIIVTSKYQSEVEKNIFPQREKKQFLQYVKPYSSLCFTQNARDELRSGLNILTPVSIICCLFLALVSRNVLGFIVRVCCISLTYMYADYIPHALNYPKRYDSLNNNLNEQSKSINGLSKIYKQEYILTGFDRDKKIYKELAKYKEPDDIKDKVRFIEQDNCIKCILFMKVDSIKCPDIIYNIILMFFNCLLVTPQVPEYVIKDFLTYANLNSSILIPRILIVVNILFLIINVIVLLNYKNSCEYIYELGVNINTSDYKKRFNLYKKIKKEKNFEIIRSRGVFVFCSSYFIDKGLTLEKLDMNYKMLFVHKLYANIPRFWVTIMLSYIAIFCILLSLSISIYMIVCIYIILVLFMIIFRLYFLPDLGKRSIVSMYIQS